jgi:hypothetical protein
VTVADNQEHLVAVFRRLHKLACDEKRCFSFHDTCEFISAMSGMRISEVRERLIEVDCDDVAGEVGDP